MGAVLRDFLHCPEIVAGRECSDSGDIVLGSMSGRLWLVADMSIARTYHMVIRIFDATHSDDIGAYIK